VCVGDYVQIGKGTQEWCSKSSRTAAARAFMAQSIDLRVRDSEIRSQNRESKRGGYLSRFKRKWPPVSGDP